MSSKPIQYDSCWDRHDLEWIYSNPSASLLEIKLELEPGILCNTSDFVGQKKCAMIETSYREEMEIFNTASVFLRTWPERNEKLISLLEEISIRFNGFRKEVAHARTSEDLVNLKKVMYSDDYGYITEIKYNKIENMVNCLLAEDSRIRAQKLRGITEAEAQRYAFISFSHTKCQYSAEWVVSTHPSSSTTPSKYTILGQDANLHHYILEWIDSQRVIRQSIDTDLQIEAQRTKDYLQGQRIIDDATEMLKTDFRNPEELYEILQQHIETMDAFEDPPSTQGLNSPSSSSSPTPPDTSSGSLGSPPFVEIQLMTDALQSLHVGLVNQKSQLETVQIERCQRQLNVKMEGSLEGVIVAGFQLIRRGIDKRLSALSSAIEEIAPQLAIARELPLFIDVIFQATQEAAVELKIAIDEREAKCQETLELLRHSAASLVSTLIHIYRAQIAFFSNECRGLIQKLQTARQIGLIDIVTKL